MKVNVISTEGPKFPEVALYGIFLKNRKIHPLSVLKEVEILNAIKGSKRIIFFTH